MPKATASAPAAKGAGVTRQKILEAATRAFASRGFSGASLRDIGTDAGINFQSIRYHFGSKEQLWEAVVKDLCNQSQEAALHHEQASVALDPPQRLRAQIRAIVAYETDNPELQQILIREAIKDSPRYRKVYKTYVSRFFELSSNFLGQMQQAGVVKKDIPLEELSFIMHGALIYRLIAPAHAAVHHGKKKKSDLIDAHADAVAKLLTA